MTQNGANPRIEPGRRSDSHEEFLELCALSTSGSLTDTEQRTLQDHLQVCSACFDTLKDFQRLSGVALPVLAPDFVSNLDSYPLVGSAELVKQRLLEQARSESASVAGLATSSTFGNSVSKSGHDRGLSSLFGLWHHEPAFRYAAAFLVLIAFTALGYHVGQRRATVPFNTSQRLREIGDQSLQQQVSGLVQYSGKLAAQLRERDYHIRDLAGQNILQLSDITKLKNAEKTLQATVRDVQTTSTEISSERDRAEQQLKSTQNYLGQVSQQLALAENKFARTQSDLDSLRQKRDTDLIKLTSLETRIEELSKQLKGREDTIAQQQELLASDRDIRELMGARDLYLAEVYDTRSNGENEKPFGRVFFTKNKSLIFYAYDLDQQPGVQNASTFQAWGRRGEDRKHAVSLGIFYMDSAANKRWVLKVDDPQTLQQIDSVFVTVEPRGGSREPSRNKLLFAWLRVPPNHP